MSSISKRQTLRDKMNDWLYDHQKTKTVLSWALAILISTFSAVVFSLGFNTFIDPGLADIYPAKIASGGASGISQVITLALEVFGWHDIDAKLAVSILYFVVNVPIICLAIFGIGKRFGILTLINVAESAIFIRLINGSTIPWLAEITRFVNNNGGLLARAIFGGFLTGLSSAIPFKADFSAGGMDVPAYYISLKKRSLTGKYTAAINVTIMILFTIFSSIKAIEYSHLGIPVVGDSSTIATLTISNGSPIATIAEVGGGNEAGIIVPHFIGSIFYSIIYQFMSVTVVDSINLRNKKVKIEVVTDSPDLGKVLISVFPHGATLVKGEGVFSGHPKYIFAMVVSSYELKKVIKTITREDPNAFVEVHELYSVVGKFFTKPVR